MFKVYALFENLAKAVRFAKELEIRNFQYKLDIVDYDEPTLRFTIFAEISNSVEDLTIIRQLEKTARLS